MTALHNIIHHFLLFNCWFRYDSKVIVGHVKWIGGAARVLLRSVLFIKISEEQHKNLGDTHQQKTLYLEAVSPTSKKFCPIDLFTNYAHPSLIFVYFSRYSVETAIRCRINLFCKGLSCRSNFFCSNLTPKIMEVSTKITLEFFHEQPQRRWLTKALWRASSISK